MIISEKYGFIIATPVKTGTTTLLGMADSWRKQGGKSSVLRALTGDPVTKHRMAPIERHVDLDRWMTVRDPRDRLPSMYEWMRKWKYPFALHNAIWDAENRRDRVAGWQAFIMAIDGIRSAEGYHNGGKRRAGTRQPYMWTDVQEEHWHYLYGIDTDGSLLDWYREEAQPRTMQCHDLEMEWMSLLSKYQVDEDDLYELKVPHLNRSRDRLAGVGGDYRALLNGEGRKVFDRLVALDGAIA